MKELLLFLTSNYPIERVNKELLENKYNLFDNVKLLNENDLDSNITKIINFIKFNYGEKGYGYWIWKPYIILQELNKLNEGDILVHLDCHCKLDKLKDKFQNIVDYLNISDNPLIVANLGFNDYQYTTTKLKNAVEKYLNYIFSEDELLDAQHEAGILFMKKCDFVVNYFQQYFNIMNENIDVITDIYNNDKSNHLSFVDNRHDQSVCSLLAKYYKITNFDIWWSDLH